MKRYDIRNVASGQITNSWTDDQLPSDHYEICFGKPERWVTDQNEDVSEALETRTIVVTPGSEIQYDEETGEIIQEAIQEVSYNEYLLPSEYTLEETDVTAEAQREALIQDGQRRQALGANVIAKVYSINESKNITPQVFAAMIADANLERIERMLWTGSLRTAKLMIQALDNTYFTNDEKTSILSMLADY